MATGLSDANMSDVVRVGPQRLIGEILTMKGDTASIQVYEETSGLGPGAEVITTGAPMSVELGPGMIEGIYDGIQRPLEKIVEKVGDCITRGVEVPAIDHEKKWEFTATAKVGDKVTGGDIIGTVPETPVVLHKIMVPPYNHGAPQHERHHHRHQERFLQRDGDHRHPEDRRRQGSAPDHDPEVARPRGSSLQPQVSSQASFVLRPAYHRHHVPHRQGRYGGCSRSLRFR